MRSRLGNRFRRTVVRAGELPTEEDIWVNKKNTKTYLEYLKAHIDHPCLVRGIEDFPWEERFVFGYGTEKEYNELKKTQPSCTDTYQILKLSTDEVSDWAPTVGRDIVALARRVSDNREYLLGLSWLKAKDEESINYELLHDYSVWFVNHA